jgi:hypothetical protein
VPIERIQPLVFASSVGPIGERLWEPAHDLEKISIKSMHGGGGKSTGIEPSLGNMQFILVEIVVSLERVDMTPALSNSWGK